MGSTPELRTVYVQIQGGQQDLFSSLDEGALDRILQALERRQILDGVGDRDVERGGEGEGCPSGIPTPDGTVS
ncbi:hypothetical protein [Thiocystis violacea]|uniref:hypothetical protein n=1 Tax=Thiocystis violacea TaxID=13725 RepID=UPI001906FFD6|nr:hypothetical protein [Thiocystis violacea]MBK1719195.1 hypothetical protein [Thiocystis violacea]